MELVLRDFIPMYALGGFLRACVFNEEGSCEWGQWLEKLVAFDTTGHKSNIQFKNSIGS